MKDKIAEICRKLEMISAGLNSAEHDAREINMRLHRAKNNISHAVSALRAVWDEMIESEGEK